MKLVKTVGELKKSGYCSRSVREELRSNLIEQIRSGKKRWAGIVGYDRTVIPQLENAILSRHHILLLGLRGQAKTRILRQLTDLCDEFLPYIKGSSLREDPFAPVTPKYQKIVTEAGGDLDIDWLTREERYNEKLATPDVSVADLIGDIDPIKAVRDKLDLSDEEAIHWGIVPRTNRGIFTINELPDLQPRIQVSLLNILEENDMQIRGFPIRIKLDIVAAFTANPEDYTNRGNIITPLKDRIASQINTHYPASLEHAKRITAQEAWTQRGVNIAVPELMKDIIEEVAFAARDSEHIDQTSGVSARLPISVFENLLSNVERRAAANGEDDYIPRICDLYASISAIIGKVELVYEGEIEGPTKVAVNLIGEATHKVFSRAFPPPRHERKRSSDAPKENNIYEPIIDFFASGKRLELSDELSRADYCKRLEEIVGLRELARDLHGNSDEKELYLVMEFILEGLHRCNVIAKESPDNKYIYADMLENILRS